MCHKRAVGLITLTMTLLYAWFTLMDSFDLLSVNCVIYVLQLNELLFLHKFDVI